MLPQTGTEARPLGLQQRALHSRKRGTCHVLTCVPSYPGSVPRSPATTTSPGLATLQVLQVLRESESAEAAAPVDSSCGCTGEARSCTLTVAARCHQRRLIFCGPAVRGTGLALEAAEEVHFARELSLHSETNESPLGER